MATLAQVRSLEERLEGLRRTWQARAEEFAEHLCNEVAAAYRQAAQELQSELRGWGRELLTIGQAAAESGYSEEHLRRLARHAKIPVERGKGARNHLRVRRGHLPAKAIQSPRGNGLLRQQYQPDEDARDIAQRLGGSDV